MKAERTFFRWGIRGRPDTLNKRQPLEMGMSEAAGWSGAGRAEVGLEKQGQTPTGPAGIRMAGPPGASTVKPGNTRDSLRLERWSGSTPSQEAESWLARFLDKNRLLNE